MKLSYKAFPLLFNYFVRFGGRLADEGGKSEEIWFL
jgi:hypothetical protein